MKSGPIATLLVIFLLTTTIGVYPFHNVQAQANRLKVDLNDTDTSFLGEVGGDYAGSSVTFVGDVNGDGYDDILVGAPYNEEVGLQAGQIYLIFGSASGWNMDTDLSTANASFVAEHTGDTLGYVAGGCDVNGDDYDDMLIGAPNNAEVAQMSGEVYLVLGKPTGWAMDMNVSTVAIASFRGEAYLDNAGTNLACAEDINGDSLDDILIGVPNNDFSAIISGQTYIIFGRKTGWAMDTSLASVNASFIGENVGDLSGTVAALGDVNGDKLGDFLVGAHGNTEGGGQGGNVQNQAGQVYLIFGNRSGWAIHTSLSNANASFWGQVGDGLGRSIAGAGDVNGDGFKDLLVGIHGFTDKKQAQGKVHLLFGKTSGWTKDQRIGVVSDASFLGAEAGENAGILLDGTGDFNGDSYDDILIGTRNEDHAAYIVFGSSDSWSDDMDLVNADIVFFGVQVRYSLDGGSDFNADGFADVLIGDGYDNEKANGAGQTFLTLGFQLTEPSTFVSITIYLEQECQNETTWADLHQELFYEVIATGGDPGRIDSLQVNVSSDRSLPQGFKVRLYETGLATDSYRGFLWIEDQTDTGNRWIGTTPGEHIVISVVKDPAKRAVVLVGHVTIKPLMDQDTAIEDMAYSVNFFTENQTVLNMTYETNADWILFNTTTNDLYGVPDNTDVGSCWVKVKADDGYSNTDEETIGIEVINIAPDIFTDPVLSVLEDLEYRVDFNSSDDGQGNITWHLTTNASWLGLDANTGVLNGFPLNENTGYYWVNVTVEDGNGGRDWSNFTLTVIDVNEPPEITTKDGTVAFEDELYFVKYTAKDNDLRDNRFVWDVATNATWLSMDNLTGILYGTPDNTDVGSFLVNVVVQDRALAEDWYNFTLTVLNTPPSIQTKDVPTATEDLAYLVHYTSDDDGQGNITWHMATNASWLKLDVAGQNLTGTPTNSDVGHQWVNISVDDGNGGWDWTNFTVTVLNMNDPPLITSAPLKNATVDSVYSYDMVAADIDKGDVLNYSLEKAPKGMTIDPSSGLILWTPKDGLEGVQEVSVAVTDGTTTVHQDFNITVWPHLVVTIEKPAEDQGVAGKYVASGTAKGPADLKVEIDLDGKGWKAVEGNRSWTYDIDTKDLKDGKHTLKVRASWKGNVSDEASVTFRVKNENGISVTTGLMLGLVLIVVVVILITAMLMMRRKKRKDEGQTAFNH